MKVLFTFGGLPHYLNPILNRLNAIENVEIIVAIPKKGSNTFGNSVKEDKTGLNFKLIYLKEKSAFYGNYYLSGLLNAIKEEKPDILITIWPYVLNIVLNFKLKRYIRRSGMKLIIKEIPFDVPLYKETFKYYKSDYAMSLNEDLKVKSKINLLFYLKHFLLRCARKYYYTSLLDASVNYIDAAFEICSSYGLKKESVFISTNSPDTELISEAYKKVKELPLILSDNPNRIIHVGRLVKWKKVDLLIKAIGILKKKFDTIELIVIGKGKEEEALKELTEMLGLKENVKFIGGVYGNEELGQYLLASSVYVLAGMGGLSINQAMAFGKPIVCSIADGTEKRLVKDNYNGFYFKPDSGNDLAYKIAAILNNSELKDKFGQNSLKIIKEEVNVHTVIDGYLCAFNYVTNNRFSLKSNK